MTRCTAMQRLPGLVVGERGDAGRGPVQVVRESVADHDRGVAAELEGDVLARHRVADLPADRAGAGEGDDRQPRVGDEGRAPGRWGPAATRPACRRAGRSRRGARRAAARTAGSPGAGLSTIGAPTAIAGATLCATRFSGKLNGAMPSTGPCGTRRTSAIRPVAAGVGVEPLHLAGEAAGLLGGPAERRHRPADLAAGPLHRLAVLGGDQLGDLLGALVEPAR